MLSSAAVLDDGPVALDQLLADLEPGGLGLLGHDHAPVLVSDPQLPLILAARLVLGEHLVNFTPTWPAVQIPPDLVQAGAVGA